MSNKVEEQTVQTAAHSTTDALAIGLAVLTAHGCPDHHTRLLETCARIGANPHGIDFITRIWHDCRKNGDSSQFRFYRNGVFGLVSQPSLTAEQSKALVPARKAKAQSADELKAKIARLQSELKATEAALSAIVANDAANSTK